MIPRYTLRELLLAFTLICVGIEGLVVLWRSETIWPLDLLWYILWYGSAAVIGTGVFTLFQRMLFGALLGIAVAAAIRFLAVKMLI